MPTILIVDDEANVRRMLGSLLRSEGYYVRESDSARASLIDVRESEPDVVLMDLMMPGDTGLDVLPELRKLAPELPVVMMSGRASLTDAVQATKLGAFHFLEKPLTPEAVLLTLRSALELRQTREINRALREELGADEEMVGQSVAIQRVRDLIERVAPTDARVLIIGRIGHRQGARRGRHPSAERAVGRAIRPRELRGHPARPRGDRSCSDTRRARSRAPPNAAAGGSSSRTKARSFSTRSGTSGSRRRRSCCARSRRGRSNASAAARRFPSASACSRRPTRICARM